MNATQHRLGSAVVLGSLAASLSEKPEEVVPNAVIACAGGHCFGTLPDLIEPATSPHHRQFFHSVAFAVALAYGLYKLYEWSPGTTEGRIFRMLGLIAGGAYLGTGVRLTFNTDAIPDLRKSLDEFARDGQRIAGTLGRERRLSASIAYRRLAEDA